MSFGLFMALGAGCRSAAYDGAGDALDSAGDLVGSAADDETDPAVGAPPAGGAAPESRARIAGSLPESTVVVIDPGAESRAERIEELAETVGASLEGDTARIVVEESVLFEFGSAELLPSASDVLDDIADLLNELAAERIDVVGHTDAVGTEEYNLDLSAERAGAVEQALIERNVGEELVEARGEGEASPVAPNENDDGSDNPEGRARNRRVEITATGISVAAGNG